MVIFFDYLEYEVWNLLIVVKNFGFVEVNCSVFSGIFFWVIVLWMDNVFRLFGMNLLFFVLFLNDFVSFLIWVSLSVYLIKKGCSIFMLFWSYYI